MYKKSVLKSLIGKRFTDPNKQRWELVEFNDLDIPYFSKVIKRKVETKKFVCSEGNKIIDKWIKEEKIHLEKSKKQIEPFRNVSFQEAKEIYLKRSKKSRMMDEKTTSRTLLENANKKWINNPSNGGDIMGIDTKKYKMKDAKDSIAYVMSMNERLKENMFKVIDKDTVLLTMPSFISEKNARQTISDLLLLRYNNVRVYVGKKEKDWVNLWIKIVNIK